MSRRGTDDSEGHRREDSDEETGWIADLRKAKKADSMSRSDFSSGGTDRWAKLSALSGDSGEQAPPEPPAGRRRAAEPAEPPPQPQPPRRAAKASPEPPVREPAREPAREPDPKPTGRRARPEPPREPEPEPKSLIGRRARPEPPREPEPDPKSLIGRRARPEPPREPEPDPKSLIGRRARPEPAPEKEPLIGRRARPEPPREPVVEKEPIFGRRARKEAEPFPMPDGLHDSGAGRLRRDRSEPPPSRVEPDRRTPAGPPPPPPAEPPRRRALFGPSTDEPPRRRPIFGDRGRAGPVPPPPVPISTPPNPVSTPPRAPISTPPRAPISTPPRAPVSQPSVSAPPMSRPVSTPPRAPVSSPSSPSSSIPASMPSSMPSSMPASPISTPPRPDAPVGPGGGPRVRLAAGVDMIKGARSEVRKQLREQQRLRMWTLIVLVVAVVGALPFYFVLQEVSRDPVITSLDSLNLPEWAMTDKEDNITGSRWCLMDCRYRERTAKSNRSIPETAKLYQEALMSGGWTQLTGLPGCPPEVAKGEHASCWRRDEFTLDLWIREPALCTEDPLRKRPTVGPTASPDPSSPAQPTVDECTSTSSVTIKVFNAIADERLRWSPETPTPNPEMGELTDEDLNTPGPTPSAG